MADFVTVNDDGAIPIPDAVRETLGWRPGDRLTVEMDGYAVKFRLDATPGVMSTGAVTFAPKAAPAAEAAPAAPAAASIVDRLIAERLAETRSGEPA